MPTTIFSTAAWTASGRTAIADALNKEFALGIKMDSITVDQAQRIGDISYSQGTWTADMKGPDGKDVPVNGHWLIVAKCQISLGNPPIRPLISGAKGAARSCPAGCIAEVGLRWCGATPRNRTEDLDVKACKEATDGVSASHRSNYKIIATQCWRF